VGEIYYLSTRGTGAGVPASRAIVDGIAPDGGLYVPSSIPRLDPPFSRFSGAAYRDLALEVMKNFLPDFTETELGDCLTKAYDDKFDTPEIAPVVKKAGVFFLELHHGATAAFKDMALSVLPHLLTTAGRKAGIRGEIVILTATSGDTGKAALESFAGVAGTRIIVFYPEKGVSPIQERQMVTQEGDNTFVVAVKGNFDDAQTAVKIIFNDQRFNARARRRDILFSSANSINIGRLIPQIVYYIHAYARLLEAGEIREGEPVDVAVPTGNFGNILASYYAAGMGLPVRRFICASNANQILFDFLDTGVYDKRRELKMTISPSMDILISSNLERLVYDLGGRDPARLKGLVESLDRRGVYEIGPDMREKLAGFRGGFATDEETIAAIGRVWRGDGYLMDTHTAVGYDVCRRHGPEGGGTTPTIVASTASPFKFPRSVVKAIEGDSPENARRTDFELLERLSALTGLPVPRPLRGIGDKPVRHSRVCRKEEMRDVVAEILDI
jgi:threonine synthase